MNPNDSSVASALLPGSNTSPVFRNGTAVAPDTHTARVNSAALLRASQEVGYTAEGDVRLQADEYKSLLLLAQRGIKAMQEAAL